jgi:flagellar hook assembly protein FlgD
LKEENLQQSARRDAGTNMARHGRAGFLLTLAVLVGSWGLAPARAFADTVPPTTTPTITSPVAGAVDSDVNVSATSTAPSVQFYLDAIEFGSPVAVAAGTASTTWPTWGLANAGSHTWTAADCNDIGCNTTQSAGVTVTVDNEAPVVTAPTDGATTSTSPRLQATAPGGGLAFAVDGGLVGFDGTAPYSYSVAGPLTEGAHSMTVQECDTSGSACDGPVAGTNFTVKALHPAVTSVAPNPFSPNGDGRNDKVSFVISLPDTENVSYAIHSQADAVVKNFPSPGTLSAGNHTYAWGGVSNAGSVVGSGYYKIVVATSAVQDGVTLHGTASANVTVDNVAPTMSNISGNGATFYPVVDGYLDTIALSATVNEPGAMWVYISNSSGRIVREFSRTHANPGTVTFTWDGRNTGGALVAAGDYHYKFLAQDPAGNRRTSSSFLVHLSHKRLVSKSATISRNGDAGEFLTSDQSCTGYSYALSHFAHGVWLVNQCDENVDGFQIIVAGYSFTVPGAVKYQNIRVRSYGNTDSAPEPIAALIYNVSTAAWDVVGEVSLTHSGTNTWSAYGTVPAPNHVGPSRGVKIRIAVPDSSPPEDYDLGYAQIIVAYSVLQ